MQFSFWTLVLQLPWHEQNCWWSRCICPKQWLWKMKRQRHLRFSPLDPTDGHTRTERCGTVCGTGGSQTHGGTMLWAWLHLPLVAWSPQEVFCIPGRGGTLVTQRFGEPFAPNHLSSNKYVKPFKKKIRKDDHQFSIPVIQVFRGRT